MITEIVYFDLPKSMSREEIIEKYRQTAPGWAENEDLIQKFYHFDEDNSRGGAVYIWKTLAAAEKWHGEEFVARITEFYGAPPKMVRHDTLLVVDNTSGNPGTITEPAKG